MRLKPNFPFSHHEIASAQHEIDFTFEDALAAADKVTTFKMVVRTIAKRYGLHATFMPKPLQEMNGSGMHLNMQLYKDGRNVFEGEDGNLSREGEAFLAGICEHIDGITAILNPLVNSYKRLVPRFLGSVRIPLISWENSSGAFNSLCIPSRPASRQSANTR